VYETGQRLYEYEHWLDYTEWRDNVLNELCYTSRHPANVSQKSRKHG